MDAAGLVRGAHAAYVGGHVGDYKVDFSPSQGFFEPPQHGLFAEISTDDHDSRHRRHFQQIDRDDASGPPDALDEHLRPTSRRGAKIDDGIAGTHQPVELQEFEQLIGRARSVPLRSRPADKGIIHVALEPGAAGFASGHSLDFLDARIIAQSAARIEGASASARSGRIDRRSRIVERGPRGNRPRSEKPRAYQSARSWRRPRRARRDLRGDLQPNRSAAGSAHRKGPRPVPREPRTGSRIAEGIAPQEAPRALGWTLQGFTTCSMPT